MFPLYDQLGMIHVKLHRPVQLQIYRPDNQVSTSLCGHVCENEKMHTHRPT